MKLCRRTFLHFAAGVAGLPVVSRPASAQPYPSRPVRLIVGFAPGGPGDILARLIGQWLQERLGQPFVIENRPAAGHTLLLVVSANAINATLYDKLNYNFIRDIAPIAGITREPNIMVVNPSFPAKTVPEFIAEAKANPGKITMASAGNGTPPHLVGELFKMMAGVDLVHVPYRGGAPAVTDLLGGQVQVYFGTSSASVEYVRTGKLRALAVTSATRSIALPDLPTVGDFVPGFEASTWFGLGAAKNTPAEIVDKLNKETNAGLADERIKARLADLGGAPLALSPGDFGKFLAEETEKWGKVVRFAGAKAD